MKNKRTVTIGIPAHNESKTIGRLLRQIMEQQTNNYTYDAIIVACDGCTDSTADVVREFSQSFPVVHVIDDGRRLGKTRRLAEFYENNTSDVFIGFDGDVELGNCSVVDEIVTCFEDPNVGLVGGYDLPKRGETFIEKIVVCGIDLWLETRRYINKGDSVHNSHGCAIALSRLLCKEARLDTSVVSDDEYIYLRAKELGYAFRYCVTSPVYYAAPNTFRDYVRQSARFMGFKDSLQRLMGDWIDAYYGVPFWYKIRAIFVMFYREPIFAPLSILLQLYVRYFGHFYLEKNISGGMWTAAASTKR